LASPPRNHHRSREEAFPPGDVAGLLPDYQLDSTKFVESSFTGEFSMSRIMTPSTNGNGTHNRISTVTDQATTSSLPGWENYPTALIGCEILFGLAMDDHPELLSAASAESLQQHYGVKWWLADSGSEKVVSVALEALLERVDWAGVAAHVQAFAQASRAE
jgi:hypothetical protein